MEISKEEIEKFRRHMGLPQEVKIGEDTFKFKPLCAEDIPDLLEVIQKFTENPEEWLKTMDKPTMELLVKLIKKMVKISYPDLTEDEISSFVSANFMNLAIALFQINDLGAKKVEKIKERLAQLRARKEAKKEG